MKKIFLIISMTLMLLGCYGSENITGKELEKRITQSEDNEHISWWYTGEDATYFYFEEKWPFDIYSWKVKRFNFNIEQNFIPKHVADMSEEEPELKVLNYK